MKFFKNVKDSIYNPDHYHSLIAKPFSSALKYFLLFILLLTLLTTIILSFTAIPKIKFFIDKMGEEILRYYPDELEIVIKKGKVSTNVQEPYFIKIPSGKTSSDLENILVINTKAPFSLENFKDYKTVCLLTEENLVGYDENQTIKIIPLTNISDFKLNESIVSSFLTKIQPFFKLFYPFSILVFFMAIFIASLWRMIYLFFGALLIWLVAKVRKVDIGYKKSYQLGLYLMTAPLLIDFLIKYGLKPLGVPLNIPYLFTIVLIVMAVLNLKAKTIVENPQIPANPPS
jgi:hypothetical protein